MANPLLFCKASSLHARVVLVQCSDRSGSSPSRRVWYPCCGIWTTCPWLWSRKSSVKKSYADTGVRSSPGSVSVRTMVRNVWFEGPGYANIYQTHYHAILSLWDKNIFNFLFRLREQRFRVLNNCFKSLMSHLCSNTVLLCVYLTSYTHIRHRLLQGVC